MLAPITYEVLHAELNSAAWFSRAESTGLGTDQVDRKRGPVTRRPRRVTGEGEEVTFYPENYPDFPMPQRLTSSFSEIDAPRDNDCGRADAHEPQLTGLGSHLKLWPVLILPGKTGPCGCDSTRPPPRSSDAGVRTRPLR